MKRSSSTVALALLQTRCSPDSEANLKKALRAAEGAAGAGAQIICTQELFRSQYFCQSEDHKYFALAEPIPGPGTDALQKLAKKHNVVVIASLFAKRAAGVYHNTAAILDADQRRSSRAGRLSLPSCKHHQHARLPDLPLWFRSSLTGR